MAGKNDKVLGVYEICNNKTNFVYLGKSTGVGVALRSARSKLKNKKFHNRSLQSEYDNSDIADYTFDIHIVSEGDNMDNLFDSISQDVIEDGFLMHNDIDSIEVDNIFDAIDSMNSKQMTLMRKIAKCVINNVNIYDLNLIANKM